MHKCAFEAFAYIFPFFYNIYIFYFSNSKCFIILFIFSISSTLFRWSYRFNYCISIL